MIHQAATVCILVCSGGKSSFINAFTHQEVSIVADVAGTTTDPVYKPMEISPLGPCVIIDTAGFDDETELGERRVEKTKLAAEKADIAVIVVSGADACREDASETKDAKEKLQQSSEKNQENLPDLTEELKWYQFLKEKNTPVLFLVGKADIDPHTDELASYIKEKTGKQALTVSAKTGAGIDAVREELARLVPENYGDRLITGDLVTEEDFVLLVMPQDIQAPKGRLILPQVQAIRELLDAHAKCLVVQQDRVAESIAELRHPPKLVMADSQVIMDVAAQTPEDIPLTTFSIQMAYSKADVIEMARGTAALASLEDGDRVLICEPCSHHPQKDDIGRIKIPRWLRQKTGKDLQIEVAVGKDFPVDLTPYKVLIQCGGCVVTRRHMLMRLRAAHAQNVPMTNYGLTISYLQGVLERVLLCHPEALKAYRDALTK